MFRTLFMYFCTHLKIYIFPKIQPSIIFILVCFTYYLTKGRVFSDFFINSLKKNSWRDVKYKICTHEARSRHIRFSAKLGCSKRFRIFFITYLKFSLLSKEFILYLLGYLYSRHDKFFNFKKKNLIKIFWSLKIQ